MNYLTAPQVKDIVRLCGQQIRLFLSESDAANFRGDAKTAIAAFKETPEEFSDEALLAKGSDVSQAHKFPVRIELRGASSVGAAQVVAKGVWGKARTTAIKSLRKELVPYKDELIVRTAGSSSFEFNRAGVDKSLPIRFLQVAWEDILDQMGYVPGKINSRKDRIVIAADGDGTLYEGPKTTHLPTVKDSPAFVPLLNYIKNGGIFMLVSGNDLNRTFKRLIEGMPKEVYSRLLLAANGGADMACVSPEGKPVFIKDYRTTALDVAAEKNRVPILDIYYLGDDDALDGNDRAAFETVGPKRAVLVRTLFDTQAFLEKWLHERKISPA
jgi:hypothetical protein